MVLVVLVLVVVALCHQQPQKQDLSERRHGCWMGWWSLWWIGLYQFTRTSEQIRGAHSFACFLNPPDVPYQVMWFGSCGWKVDGRAPFVIDGLWYVDRGSGLKLELKFLVFGGLSVG